MTRRGQKCDAIAPRKGASSFDDEHGEGDSGKLRHRRGKETGRQNVLDDQWRMYGATSGISDDLDTQKEM